MAISTQGTKLAHSVDGTAWTDFVGLREVATPKPVYSSIETTHLDSVAVEKVPGLPDNGGFTFKILHTSATFSVLLGMYGLPRFFRVTFSDGRGYSMPGFLKEMGSTAGPNAALEWDCSVEVTGPVTAITGA